MHGADSTVALHAMYLWRGFGEPTSVESSPFGGHIGISSWVSGFAPMVAAVYAAVNRVHDHHPDVFEYQVTGAMGAWLRENLTATPVQFCAQLRQENEKFFGESCDFLDPVLASIVDGTHPTSSSLLALATTALVDLKNGWPAKEISSTHGTGLDQLIDELAHFQRGQGYDDEGAWGDKPTEEAPQG